MIWHLDALTTLRCLLLSSLWAAAVIAAPRAGLSARWGLERSGAAHLASRGSLLAFFLAWMSTVLVLNFAAAPQLVINDPVAEKAWLPVLLDRYAPQDTHLGWQTWEGLWLLGFAIALVRLVADLLRVDAWLRSTQPLLLDSVLGERDEGLKAHMTRRRITVRTSEHVHQPCALGHRQPTILIPAGFLESFPPDERHALLAHEVAHLDRYDVLKNLGLEVLSAVLWFNPGFFALRAAYVRSRELACDARACRHLDSPIVLARALERVARLEPAPLPALGSLGGGGALLDRVRVLAGKSSALPPRRSAAFATLLAISAGLGLAAAQMGASSYFREQSRHSYLAAERLDLDRFTAEVCSLLRDDGLYETDRFGGGDGPVSLTLRDREAVLNGHRVPSPTQERLRDIFADHGVRWRDETFLRFYQADSEVGSRAGSARVGERIGSGRWLEGVP